MDKESQVKMAREWLEKHQFVTVIEWDDIRAGLAEESRKARAWDALYEAAGRCDHGIITVTAHMDKLLKQFIDPTPKDPLEELYRTIAKMEPWGTTQSPAVPMKMLLDREEVLAEILRLRGKK